MAEMDTDDLLLLRASQWHRCEDGLFCETRVTVLKFNNESLGCVVRHVDGGGRGWWRESGKFRCMFDRLSVVYQITLGCGLHFQLEQEQSLKQYT